MSQTNTCLKFVDYKPKRLIGFASVVPNLADVAIKELKKAIVELGLKGLKLHLGMQGFCLRNTHFWRVLRFAGELGIPVIIHTLFGDLSTLYFKSLFSPWESLEDYALLPFVAPDTVIVLAHMGGSFHFEDVLQIAAGGRNIYVDTSYSLITTVQRVGVKWFAECVKSLGSEKFLYGSDYVMGLTPEEYGASRQIAIIRNLPISDSDKGLCSIFHFRSKLLIKLEVINLLVLHKCKEE